MDLGVAGMRRWGVPAGPCAEVSPGSHGHAGWAPCTCPVPRSATTSLGARSSCSPMTVACSAGTHRFSVSDVLDRMARSNRYSASAPERDEAGPAKPYNATQAPPSPVLPLRAWQVCHVAS